MNRKTGRTAYIESGQWDEKTIDSVYEEQLDRTGGILDQIQTAGLRIIRDADPLVRTALILFEQIEKELLVQWQTKRDGGLEKLFERQRQWLNRELRRQDGLMAAWNEYADHAFQKLAAAEELLVSNPWQSTVLKIMSDRRSYPGQQGGSNSTKQEQLLENCCIVFKALYDTCPHHQVIGFLNLVELGTGNRPEICDPGEAVQLPERGRISQELAALLAGLDTPEAWTAMPVRLIEFWGDANNSSND